MKYRVCTYDVWGNEQDGFEVNDVYSAGTIEISELASDRAVERMCREHLDILPSVELRMEWSGDDRCEFDNAETGRPLFHIEGVR